MAWTDSRMFEAWIEGMFEGAATSYTGLDSDTVLAALYNNSVTPDRDAAVASTGYNTGTWAVANEVDDGTNWDAGGEPLASKTSASVGTGIYGFDAADTSQSGASCTLADVHGCLVYDGTVSGGTVADQGVSFHYFGGAQGVTAGTFTIVWHANGLFRITV